MAHRIAKSLDVIRSQINTKYPDRSKLSDGWIGDEKHQASASDHNPNSAGVVTALDITHDPAHRLDTWKLAEILRQHKDPRIKYVISNGRIFSSVSSPWVWRPYTGTNKHAHHIHISVMGDPRQFDSAAPWDLDDVIPISAPPPIVPPKGITEAMRRRMMEVILGYEGRFVGGKLQVFIAPDGLPEIGGITQKDHPSVYASLKQILDRGDQTTLLSVVLKYYGTYTNPAQNWTDKAGVEFFLRDCILNRGPTGAAEILQMAMGVEVDHQIGPTTRGALAKLDPNVAIDKLRIAREKYEEKKYGKAFRQSRGQWQGLLNRWNKAQAQAKAFQKEQGSGTFPVKTTVGVGAGGAAAAVTYTFWDWITGHIVPSVIIACGAVALVVYIIRKIKGD